MCGKSQEAIDMNADIRDTREYMVNSGDELIDEVIEERRLKRAKANGLSERLQNDSEMMIGQMIRCELW